MLVSVSKSKNESKALRKNAIKASYTKFYNEETGEYLYKVKLPRGHTEFVSKEMGDYLNAMEQKALNQEQ